MNILLFHALLSFFDSIKLIDYFYLIISGLVQLSMTWLTLFSFWNFMKSTTNHSILYLKCPQTIIDVACGMMNKVDDFVNVN